MRKIFGRRAIVLLAFAALPATAGAQLVSSLSPPVTTDQLAAVQAQIPTPSSTMPPGVTDSGSPGTLTTIYALANHTHASKARKGRVLTPAAGFLDVTFSTPFTTTPVCAVTAETTSGDTNVVNAQIDGAPTATGMRVRITRTAVTAVALLGLSVLSVPTQVATYTHYICLEP